MEESVMRDLKTARNLFRAYIGNGDYANAERVLSHARDDLRKAGEYVDGLNLAGEFLAPEDEFSRRNDAVTKTANAFTKSIKTYKFLDDEQNASLVKKRLGHYLRRKSEHFQDKFNRTSKYVKDKFNEEVREMSEAIENGDWKSARNHINISKLYNENGGFDTDGKTSQTLNRLERSLEYLAGIESFREKFMSMQPPEEELFSTRSEKIETLYKRALFVNSLRKAKKRFQEIAYN